jgi:hypothetical protein
MEYRFVFAEIIDFENRLRAVMHSAESLKFANCSVNSKPYAKIVLVLVLVQAPVVDAYHGSSTLLQAERSSS